MIVSIMPVINISGNTPIDDPEYRYKMPTVFGKIEGRGNGIKTVVPNILELAQSLHRDPGEVNKFFGCELGAQVSISPLFVLIAMYDFLDKVTPLNVFTFFRKEGRKVHVNVCKSTFCFLFVSANKNEPCLTFYR